MKLYKLTDENAQTYNNTQWGEGVTHKATGDRQKLCSDGFIHAYESPLVAVFMNPIHASFSNPRLWEAKGEVTARDGCLKCGCRELTTIREIPVPEITPKQGVRMARRCTEYAAKYASVADSAAYGAAVTASIWTARAAKDAGSTWWEMLWSRWAARAAEATNWAFKAAASDSKAAEFNLHKIIEEVLTSDD